MTACHCLFADGPLLGGTVLVAGGAGAGGAGAVGHFAIELARWTGAQQVVNYQDPDAIDQITATAR